MKISIIAAVAENFAIGYKNKLIYWIPNDLKRFKSLTVGHTIIMGRNTFESLPNGALPNRRNVVLSNTVRECPGCDVYRSLNEALDSCNDGEEVFIIGGAKLYNEAINVANKLYLTEIKDIPKVADAYFPKYDGWKIDYREEHTKDEKNTFDYAFVDYVREKEY